MKKILGSWIAMSALFFAFASHAQNPEAEDLAGAKKQKRPGDALVVRIDQKGNKTVYSVPAKAKLSSADFKAVVEKLENDQVDADVVASVNPESEDLGVAPSWYYRGGYGYGYYNSYHYGYGYNYNWGYYGYPRYYNSYRYTYGYYYQPYYAPYYYGGCSWYYYY